jgi:hypothetical protein
MTNKIIGLGLIWLFVITAYIILAISMPAIRELSTEASTQLTASANMSNFPGAQEAVDSSPYYLWFIPGTVGMITTVMFLVKNK